MAIGSITFTGSTGGMKVRVTEGKQRKQRSSQSPVFVVLEKERGSDSGSGAEVWSDTKVVAQHEDEVWQL